jgi:hypothetical protein
MIPLCLPKVCVFIYVMLPTLEPRPETYRTFFQVNVVAGNWRKSPINIKHRMFHIYFQVALKETVLGGSAPTNVRMKTHLSGCDHLVGNSMKKANSKSPISVSSVYCLPRCFASGEPEPVNTSATTAPWLSG